jgi:hypothetical protein
MQRPLRSSPFPKINKATSWENTVNKQEFKSRTIRTRASLIIWQRIYMARPSDRRPVLARSFCSPGLLSNDHGTRRRRRQGISRFTASARESDRKYIRILFQPTYAASFLRYSLDLLPLHVTPATRKLSLERNVRTSTSLSQEVETCVLPISEHAGLDTIWWFHFRPYV